MSTVRMFPRAFVEDCLDCECDVGQPIRQTRAYIWLRQTDAQRDELRSRAMHYAHDGLDLAPWRLVKSARAVLRHLEGRR